MSDKTVTENKDGGQPLQKMPRFDAIVDKVFIFLLAYSLLVLIAIVIWQIVTRTLGILNVWTEGLSRWIFVWMCFLGAAYFVHKKDQIIVDLIKEIKVLNRICVSLEIPFRVIMLTLYAVLAYGGILCVIGYGGEKSAAFDLPMRVLYYACPVGFLLMTIFEFINIIRLIGATIQKIKTRPQNL